MNIAPCAAKITVNVHCLSSTLYELFLQNVCKTLQYHLEIVTGLGRSDCIGYKRLEVRHMKLC